MDLGLLIAVLSLLVNTIGEVRETWKDRSQSDIRPLGISLLQLILSLDEIIDVGKKLVTALAGFRPKHDSVHAFWLGEPTKHKILSLVRQQLENLDAFTKICEIPLSLMSYGPSVSLGDALELMVPDDTIQVGEGKSQYLKILTWKLLEGEAPLSKFSMVARLTLQALSNSSKCEANEYDSSNACTLHFPTKVRIKQIHARSSEGKIEDTQVVSYDLTKSSDLRRLLEKANDQLEELGHLRERLAQLTRQSFSLDDLVRTD